MTDPETPYRGGGSGVPEGEWMICAICSRVLERFDAIEGSKIVQFEWLHPHDLREAGEDHAPVPIMEKDFNALSEISEKCDFCFADRPMQVLPVDDFDMYALGNTVHRSRSHWACCDDCAELIRKGYWDRLCKRAIKLHTDRRLTPALPPNIDVAGYNEAIAMHIRLLYRKVSQHVTGPLYPNPNYHRALPLEADKEERDEPS